MTQTDTTDNETIQLEDLHSPGVLFAVDGHEFVTTGGTGRDGGPNVIRLNTGTSEQLNGKLLAEDIRSGRLTRLDTHDGDTEAAIDRMDLATLTDYAGSDLYCYETPEDLFDAVKAGHDALETDAEQRPDILLEENC